MGIWFIAQPIGGKKSWPAGTNGPLLVTTGNTTVLPAGSVMDYSSIEIQVGATLQIGPGSGWTIIGCSGNCDISGTITGYQGQDTGGTFTATAPDGANLSYMIVQNAGGSGGSGFAAGGAASSGNGGGGGGLSAGSAATSSAGGSGSSGEGAETVGVGGTGASVYGTSGTAGTGSLTNTKLVLAGASNDAMYVVDQTGGLWASGNNQYGQLGNGTLTNYSSPISVSGGRSFIAISRGCEAEHKLAIQASTSYLYAWGSSLYGECGTSDDQRNYSTPQVIFSSSVAVVGTNKYSSIIAHAYDFGLHAWGRNNYGQLGFGDTVNRSSPAAVPGTGLNFRSFQHVTMGLDHAVALSFDGSVWTMGRNDIGQLGINSNTYQSTPTSVVGGRSYVTVSAGSRHTLAINGLDGSIWGWGDNSASELGDGTSNDRSSPVSVIGSRSYTAISAGRYWNVALDGSGHAWTWGDNLYGQLGNNQSAVVAQSTSVAAGSTTFTNTLTKLAQPYTVSGSSKYIPAVHVGWRMDGFPDGTVYYDIVRQYEADEIQLVSFSSVPTTGTYQLTFNGYTTTNISYSDPASTVQSDLQALTSIGTGNVTVTGNTSVGFTVAFQGTLANEALPQITVASNTTGVTISTSITQEGQSPIPSPYPADIMWTGQGFPNHDPAGTPFLNPTTNTLVEDVPFVTLPTGNYYLVIYVDSNYTATYGENAGWDVTVMQGTAAASNALSWNGSTWSSIGAPLWHVIWDANSSQQSSPVSVLGGHSFQEVVAGSRSVIGVDGTGAVWAWGYAGFGQLGTNSTSNTSSPVAVAQLFTQTGVKVYGAGGGGGSRGEHGQGIYLRVTGNITGVGTVDVSGSDGGDGGDGGTATDPFEQWSATGGGGGGGGAGGSGGYLAIRYHGTLSAITTLANAGTGGTGGSAGGVDVGFRGNINEIQGISFSAVPDAGSFTLTYNGFTTVAIPYTATASTVQSAIQALPDLSTSVVAGDFAGVNAVQLISFSAVPSSGSFELSYDGFNTAAIPYTATASTVQTALTSLENIGAGNVSVTGSFSAGFTITFINTLGKQVQNLLGVFNNSTGVVITPSTLAFGNPGFEVTFQGVAGNTDQPLLVAASSLTASSIPVTITVADVTDGSPNIFEQAGTAGTAGANGNVGTLDIASI